MGDFVEIVKALVNGIPVEFTYSDAVSELTLGSNTTIAHHQVYKSRYLNALRDANEGELSIKLPLDCIQQVKKNAWITINRRFSTHISFRSLFRYQTLKLKSSIVPCFYKLKQVRSKNQILN
jgi:hypothetical protein